MRRQGAKDRVAEGENIIDSRDIIKAIEELREERDSITEAAGERWDEARADHDNCLAKRATGGDCEDHSGPEGACDCIAEKWDRETYVADSLAEEWDEDDKALLEKLEKLAEEGEGNASDWTDGATLIADDYFETYAQELAEDIGAIGKDLKWPACHIDWKAAAEALQQDYSSITYGETTYWVRS